MTREETVLRLEVLKDFSQNNELKNMHEAIDMAIEALEERKHGEWIENDFGWRCSICGNTSVMWQRTYNFCPNCGAYMRGEDDE